MKWLVIGYGNSLRQDDGFGLEVCQKLKSHLHPESAELIVTHQLMPELAEILSKASHAIFTDASIDLAPGHLQFCQMTDISFKELSSKPLFSHHCTPKTLLFHAQHLYGRAPKAWILSAGAADFSFGEELSPPVKDLVPKAVSLILDKITNTGGLSPKNDARPILED